MTYTGTVVTRDPGLIDTIDGLPEGYTGYLRVDDSAYGDSPRDWAPNLTTIIQENKRRGDVDKPDEGLDEARDRWRWTEHRSMVGAHRSDRAVKAVGRDKMIERYLAMFRPDILLYVDYWSAGRDLYGWGYITAEDFAACEYTYPVSREDFDAEVEVYRQWADGEVYGVTVVRDEDGEEASLWGVYDNPSGYVNEVALDLIEEIEA